MKKLTVFLVTLLTLWGAVTSCSRRGELTADYNVVPLPKLIEAVQGESFVLDPSTVIVYTPGDTALLSDARLCAGYLSELTGINLPVQEGEPGKGRIALMASLDNDNPEAYELKVSDGGVTINGSTPAGTFYGIQTLRKSIPEAGENNIV
ncbi:MAG: glycoside hydrolase family 20 zincin-like fold domain-containing protein, partial [Duncaniella sp.]|nr:glycoside hydrolase family 20 zincin-like fold domain-containing protein [Duncaniella sp.]